MNVIKATLYYKVIFSFLNEKTKLKFVKYNKNLQIKLDRYLNNYKFFTNQYIVYETKQKGKEYYGFGDIMQYEGEYLNGEKKWKRKRIC